MEGMQTLTATLPGNGTSSRLSFDPVEYAQKQAEWANQVPGKLTGYDCKRCLNRGYSMKLGENGRMVSVECKCMAIRRSLKILKRSGLEKLVKQSTFDLYQTQNEWQRTAKSMAQKFAKSPEGKWFLASGNAGSGKTHLCVAICRELMLRGMETRYLLWRDLVTRLRGVMNTDEYSEQLKPFKTVPVLYIDDFYKVGKGETPGKSDVSIAFELLGERYNDPNLITVISTERSMEELLDIDEAVGSRIYERSKGYVLKLTGREKNWRLRHEADD